MENSNNNRWVSPTTYPLSILLPMLYPHLFSNEGTCNKNEPVFTTNITSMAEQRTQQREESNKTTLDYIFTMTSQIARPVLLVWLPVCEEIARVRLRSLQKHPHLPKFWLTTQWSVNNSMGPKQCQNFYLAH